jgi:hypothetical protein
MLGADIAAISLRFSPSRLRCALVTNRLDKEPEMRFQKRLPEWFC